MSATILSGHLVTSTWDSGCCRNWRLW